MEIQTFLFWVYFINLVVLVIHEIESAYWHEWKLFGLPGEITGFLILHVPLLGLLFWGLIEMREQSTLGLICSLILSASGVFAYFAHNHFIKKGRSVPS